MINIRHHKKQNSGHRARNTDGLSSEFCVLCSDNDHGGNIYRIAEKLGVAENNIIDFSASINPLGLSGRVKDAIRRGLHCLVNYPDPDTKSLRERLAKRHDIDPETVLCGNGSTELIYLIPRALQPERVLIPAPTFSEYERAVRTQNTEHRTQIKYLKLKECEGFRITQDEYIAAMKELNQNAGHRTQNTDRSKARLGSVLCAPGSVSLAFLCNPNNPTGHLLRREEVLGIAEEARKVRCFLVVDEAFIDFCPAESVIDEVRDNPFLIVLRSMTKFYALTGLRIGFAVFHKSIIERIKQFKEPWTVNGLAQKAALKSRRQ